MNPLKCAFTVQSGVFLGFVVRHRGIEIERKKIKAILNMPPPQELKDLKSLQGKLAYIRRFISDLSGRIQPFAKLMKKVAKTCHGCQIHDNFKHQPLTPLYPAIPSWPFDAWGIDVIGLIDPPSSRGHRFILAATDYFSKWAEAIRLREVKSSNVINFLERNIIYRFSIPHRITSDNAKAFKSQKIYKFMEKYKIKWNYSTSYYPQANGMAEAFNKTLGKILKKTIHKHRRDWHDHLYEALWAYHVTIRTPTQATPHSLVYGSEAVLPLEIQLPSLWVTIHEELTQDE
ncbi:hypothetical protein E2562_009428 [Oryza meyeriana var. granulata]|uniref:Integrase catalytic domain-containing protein n=1 Tax=Oryza meyeriana var. granulata TaxID=110450 RepID=A0A6G1BTC8_9ORYZ|nr:hypothetical protein E2562_009428 [Oryza meyeriana var. granulata]